MTIHELNALTALTSTDELPVWDAEASGEPTKKITAQNMANSVKTLADLQGALTFDTTPTTGSTNPVTSGGIATAIAQSTATVHSYNVNGNSLVAYRIGNTVFVSCVGGTYDCPSSGAYIRVHENSNPLSQLPVGYRPVGNIDIKDTLTNKRLLMAPSSAAETGRFTGTESFSSQALRFNATWVTTDPMPT